MNSVSRSPITLNSFFAFAFSLLILSIGASTSSAQTPAKPSVEPEIVRLSYVQGDVRFSRGDSKGADLSKSWEQAVVNLPILQGYSLATGDGRAEIEFEYGSTVYLAENSVLIFQTLTDQNSLPSTELELVTGTATARVSPIAGEVFLLATPTDFLRFPVPSYMRVDSYLDAIAITPQGNGVLFDPRTNQSAVQMSKGQTTYYRNGLPVKLAPTDQPSVPADWDAWVDARVSQRQSDTAAALKASGLPSFVPGLTDLYNDGTFFPCAPFGICWEPKDPSDTAQQTAAAQPSAPTHIARNNTESASLQLVAMHIPSQQASSQQGTPPVSTPPGQKPKPKFSDYYYPIGSCPVSEIHVVTVKDPVTGKEIPVQQTVENTMWTWGVCHSGAWVHLPNRRSRFTFVAGKKRHHPPVRWMHSRNGDVYVPRHPSDVKGQPPLNLKYGAFKPENGPVGPVKRIDYKPTDKYTLLPEPPKDFRSIAYPQLAEAPRPEIHARMVSGVAPTGEKGGKSEITYDYKSRSFTQAGAPVAGRTGKPVVVSTLGAHGGSGGSNARSGGGVSRTSGGGTSHAGGTSSGSGGSHSTGSGGGSGGGGSHAGGGGSGGGGGGGSHAGGGSSGGGGGGGGSRGGGGGGGGGGRTGRGL
jgi:hypothetical protein